MPITLYCWRCRADVPMLTDEEWHAIKVLAEERATSLGERLEIVLSEYNRLTGFGETNVNAVHHHVASLYGPPCRSCARPLRTPKATVCAACGMQRDATVPAP
ncbi:MAG: hypothetical protein AAFV96_09825 [Pseudomonadota bacterium]